MGNRGNGRPIRRRPNPSERTPPIHRFQRAVAIGRYQPSGQLLLDNRVHRRRAGYHVVTPLTLADGHAIMVKRGFLADDGHRNPVSPPPPSGIVTVNGWLYTDDREAFRLPGEKQETGTVRPRLTYPPTPKNWERPYCH